MKETVLVVDDERNICAVISEYLEARHFNVLESYDLESARQQLKRGLRPDVVLLDVMLGDGNGVDFVRELRQSPITKDVPVLMMSALRNKTQDRVSGLESGADDYISKPFDLREIHLRIENLLKPLRRKRAQAESLARTDLESAGVDDIASAIKKVLIKKEKKGFIPPTEPAPTKKVLPPTSRISSLWNKFVTLLLQPAQIKEEEVSLLALSLACIGLAGLFRGVQDGIEQQSMTVGFANALVRPLSYLMLVAMIAWALQWALGLKQKAIKFRPLYISIGLGFAPLVLSGFLGVLYVAIASGQAGDFTASPLLVIPAQISSRYFGTLLRRIDLFEIWTVWLAAGFVHQQLGGREKPRCVELLPRGASLSS